MKLSDLDPCLWQYDTPASTSTFEFPELQPDNFAELKPLPPFEFPLAVPPQQAPPPVPPPPVHYDVSTTTSNIKTELAEYLLTSDIDDIAALIGSAIAEQQPSLEPVTSSTIDPWTELDAWIESACQQNDVVQSSSTDFALPSLVTEYAYSSTNSSPILQARLNPSEYNRRLRLQSSPQLPESTSNSYGSLKVEACYSSVDPHVSPTVTSTSARFKKSYNRNSPEQKMKKRKKTIIPMTIEIGSDKEKPIHRCAICNRGFLNKSNIKVHLRTHTGEKPFKCEVCGKAFRQKAHLLKHVQIHKRITRD